MSINENANADTGRAAFEQWEALGEDGESPFNLAHSAALIVEVAEECVSGQWQPEAKERAAALLLLESIGRAGKCIVNHCKTICAAPDNAPGEEPGK